MTDPNIMRLAFLVAGFVVIYVGWAGEEPTYGPRL